MHCYFFGVLSNPQSNPNNAQPKSYATRVIWGRKHTAAMSYVYHIHMQAFEQAALGSLPEAHARQLAEQLDSDKLQPSYLARILAYHKLLQNQG
jgi:hypothetical protein